MQAQSINNMAIYGYDREPSEEDLELTVIPSSHEMQLNSYFKTNNSKHKYFNSIKKTSFKTSAQTAETYLSFVDVVSTPNLFHFFSTHTDFWFDDFYHFSVNNFMQLTEKEFTFINDYMNPEKHKETILKKIIEDDNIITLKQFKHLLSQDLKKDFNGFYQQNQITKYALENFSTLEKEDKIQLWKKIDLSLSKDLFIQAAINTETKITDISFFQHYYYKADESLTNYFNLAVEKKWSDNIILFCKHFSKIPLAYFNNHFSADTDSAINFERLFLYLNPDKINQSHLDSENINLVFSKITNNLPNQDLLHQDNINFYNTLGLGIYKFIEFAYDKEPDKTNTLLTDSNSSLLNKFNILNDLIPKNNLLYMLLENIDNINSTLQQSFSDNVLIHFMPTIFEDKTLINNIVKNFDSDSFLFNTVVTNHAYSLDNNLENVLIYNLLKDFIVQSSASTNHAYLLSKKIQSFSYSGLENFNPHLKFSLAIIKEEHFADELIINSVEEIFNKAMLNKKLTNNFNIVRKDRKPKI